MARRPRTTHVNAQEKTMSFISRGATLKATQFITAASIIDLMSAKLAGPASAQALYMTGFGTVASYLDYPDDGLAICTDMLNRTAAIPRGSEEPLIAEGDTGYGGLLNVHPHPQSRAPR
jgi:2-methylisocitrate lyase-like PEP mutase family enzyme